VEAYSGLPLQLQEDYSVVHLLQHHHSVDSVLQNLQRRVDSLVLQLLLLAVAVAFLVPPLLHRLHSDQLHLRLLRQDFRLAVLQHLHQLVDYLVHPQHLLLLLPGFHLEVHQLQPHLQGYLEVRLLRQHPVAYSEDRLQHLRPGGFLEVHQHLQHRQGVYLVVLPLVLHQLQRLLGVYSVQLLLLQVAGCSAHQPLLNKEDFYHRPLLLLHPRPQILSLFLHHLKHC
jgi:hypothetical protein